MPKVTYAGRSLPVLTGETVLDCLLRNGAEVSHGCHIGACQACEQRAVSGSPGNESQIGLDETQKAKGHFLACQCTPTEDLVVEPLAATNHDVRVRAIERLSDKVLRLRLERPAGFEYRAGQFISLTHGKVMRSYSLASLPQEDADLELHVKRVREGKMTSFLFDELRVGDRVRMEGPAGGCVYVSGSPNQPLLLCGTGTGLAPLVGIVRDALHSGHRGPIQLFHGVRAASDAYAVDVLRALAAGHANFSFTVATLDASHEREFTSGPLTDVIGRSVRGTAGRKLYLCGSPDAVTALRRWAVFGGASSSDILMDPFVAAEAA
jgi:CDP-4-dehydro-6-deoxyglucose reductase, E3